MCTHTHDHEKRACSGAALAAPALVQFHHNEDLIMRQFMSGMFSREEIFTMACSRGDLADVCWLHDLILGRHVYSRQSGFVAACRDLQMHVAKWLFAQGGIDIHYERDRVFCYAAFREDWEVCRWLMSLEPHAAWPSIDIPFGSWVREAWIHAVLRA